MFRKIVTELTYSPALAGNLGDYIKQLRFERSKRQIGLVFVLLALVVQFFATASPPESANASDPAVFIDGGITSTEDYLHYYDQNTRNIKDLLRSLGITRSDIKSARPAALPSLDNASIWSMQNHRNNESFSYFFRLPGNKSEVAYYQPAGPVIATAEEYYVGSATESDTWFAIRKKDGNLVSETTKLSSCSAWYSTSVTAQSNNSLKSTTSCPETLNGSLSARAILSESTTLPSTVDASDRIEYTLTLTNTSQSPTAALPAINLEDVLEYSRILDSGSGEYNYDTKMLSWPQTTLPAGEQLERRFIVQLLPAIPSTPHGQYVVASYDCTLQVAFGTSLSTPVKCPFVKDIESLTNALTPTSKKASLLFGLTLFISAVYFYLRSRQLLTELYIIRHNHLGGL